MSAEVVIRESVELPLPLEEAFDFFLTPEAYRLFTGWGPIPGLREVVWERGSNVEVGSIGTVHNTDGSTHRERVDAIDRPRFYAVEIDRFSSAFRFLAEGTRETWELEATAGGARVDRTFTFRLRSRLLSPLGHVLGRAFAKAVRVNHANMRAHLAARGAEPAAPSARA